VLLEIRHVTQYRYAGPVRESVMEVWMQPQKSARQRLVSFDLELDPPAQLFSFADSFGNPVYHFDVPQPHEQLTITANAAVETQPPPRLPEELDIGEWDRLRSDHLRGENYVFHFSFTTWGWIHLLLGIVTAGAGAGLFFGKTWARTVAVIAAGVSLLGSFMWLPHYPIWSLVIMALDVFVIWAAIVHGRALADE